MTKSQQAAIVVQSHHRHRLPKLRERIALRRGLLTATLESPPLLRKDSNISKALRLPRNRDIRNKLPPLRNTSSHRLRDTSSSSHHHRHLILTLMTKRMTCATVPHPPKPSSTVASMEIPVGRPSKPGHPRWSIPMLMVILETRMNRPTVFSNEKWDFEKNHNRPSDRPNPANTS